MKPMNYKRGLMRLGILASIFLLIGWVVFPLKIHHFTPFNSGVSIVIAIFAVIWLIYSIAIWIGEGFKMS